MALDFSRLRAISNQHEQTSFTTVAHGFSVPPPPPLDGCIELPMEDAERVGAVFACEQIKKAIKEGVSNVGLLKIAFAVLSDLSEDKAFPEECERLIDARRHSPSYSTGLAYGLQAWQDATEIYHRYNKASTAEEFEAFSDECNELARRNYVGKALALVVADLIESGESSADLLGK